MLLPRVFGEDLLDDFFGWDDFPFFDDKASRNVEKKLYGRRAKNLMKTDIRETDTEYELTIDLPGFKKEEVHASLENGYLTISAAKGLDEEEKEKKTGRYIRKERYAGACQRSFYVGDEISEDDIRAKFEDGILKITVPKKELPAPEETKKLISIEG